MSRFSKLGQARPVAELSRRSNPTRRETKHHCTQLNDALSFYCSLGLKHSATWPGRYFWPGGASSVEAERAALRSSRAGRAASSLCSRQQRATARSIASPRPPRLLPQPPLADATQCHPLVGTGSVSVGLWPRLMWLPVSSLLSLWRRCRSSCDAAPK